MVKWGWGGGEGGKEALNGWKHAYFVLSCLIRVTHHQSLVHGQDLGRVAENVLAVLVAEDGPTSLLGTLQRFLEYLAGGNMAQGG